MRDAPAHEDGDGGLSGPLGKLKFPALQYAPGKFMTGVDAIIARFAMLTKTDPRLLPTYMAYVDGPLATILALQQERRELTLERS